MKSILKEKYWSNLEVEIETAYGFNLMKEFSSENKLRTMILRLDNF